MSSTVKSSFTKGESFARAFAPSLITSLTASFGAVDADVALLSFLRGL